MSIETAVILKRERLPAPEDWQRALREAGFAVQLDTDFDPVEMTGFLPATYDGRPGGFEYFFSALDDSDYEPEILDRLGHRDSVVSLVTHSDFAGLMTAVLAAVSAKWDRSAAQPAAAHRRGDRSAGPWPPSLLPSRVRCETLAGRQDYLSLSIAHVDMKKATTSLEQFRSQLEAIARDLHRAAKFEVGREDLPELVDVDTLCGTFFSFGDPEPAPMRGRGARLRVPLGWVWWPAEMSPEDGAALAVRRLLSIPGVEDVTRPKLDPQFGLIWQAYVVIRVSQ